MKGENDIEFKDLLKMIRKRVILISLIIICSTLAAVILSFYVLSPVYQAKSTVIVGKDSTDKITQSEVNMYQDLMKTYSEIGRSRLVAENVAERLHLDKVTEKFMLNINITPEVGTQIIDIAYKDNAPDRSAEIANALAQAFVEESQRLLPSGSVKIMDKAIAPEEPISPNKKLNIIIGFMIGLIISLTLVFLIEYLDSTIKNEDDVERYLELPMIGFIPKQNKMVNIIVSKEPKSPASEAFKSMRTNLLFSMENRGIKTLLVCSSTPKEGKTSVSTNIAFAYAQTGKRTLLIDCDLRKPTVHKYFNISNEIGLVDILMKEGKVEDILTKINCNLSVLTAGRINYNPAELISSHKMKAFIKSMEKEYDYVIIDTPPIIAFTDALSLAIEKCGVILVISSEESKIEVCKKSRQLLLNINAVLIGAVLNKVDKRLCIGYGYDYYSYGKKLNNSRNNNSK